MTTAARAKRTSVGDFNKLVVQIPIANNPSKLTDHAQGLDIQPFIFGIAACIPDLEDQLNRNFSERVLTAYCDNTRRVYALKRALSDAGFAHTGKRLTSSAPSREGLALIADTAEACLDLLQQYYRRVVREAHKTDEGRLAFAAFISRYAKFNGAFQELRDQPAEDQYRKTAGQAAPAQVFGSAAAHSSNHACAMM